ncbi:uncharacterized protein KY384_002851 [Bacidia gigantensis]|uniref:uncharacterized protein n=1 Tax=Bacidia gigantensis TaxID=2732470 RepID=UPI001D04D263|nr:uncharacterized protein KY384_002851 [Bacidia gigantensis]KAG8532366.1 hypothetical protein KY384_002851 [Bacidia gigantensis]
MDPSQTVGTKCYVDMGTVIKYNEVQDSIRKFKEQRQQQQTEPQGQQEQQQQQQEQQQQLQQQNQQEQETRKQPWRWLIFGLCLIMIIALGFWCWNTFFRGPTDSEVNDLYHFLRLAHHLKQRIKPVKSLRYDAVDLRARKQCIKSLAPFTHVGPQNIFSARRNKIYSFKHFPAHIRNAHRHCSPYFQGLEGDIFRRTLRSVQTARYTQGGLTHLKDISAKQALNYVWSKWDHQSQTIYNTLAPLFLYLWSILGRLWSFTRSSLIATLIMARITKPDPAKPDEDPDAIAIAWLADWLATQREVIWWMITGRFLWDW